MFLAELFRSQSSPEGMKRVMNVKQIEDSLEVSSIHSLDLLLTSYSLLSFIPLLEVYYHISISFLMNSILKFARLYWADFVLCFFGAEVNFALESRSSRFIKLHNAKKNEKIPHASTFRPHILIDSRTHIYTHCNHTVAAGTRAEEKRKRRKLFHHVISLLFPPSSCDSFDGSSGKLSSHIIFIEFKGENYIFIWLLATGSCFTTRITIIISSTWASSTANSHSAAWLLEI